MRCSITSEFVVEDVEVFKTALLPGSGGLSTPLSCFTQARYGIVYEVLGALGSIYKEANCKKRSTFGKVIANRQLIQSKLVDMISDHVKGLLVPWRLGVLKDIGKLKCSYVSHA